jgi:hypothetical protein
MNLCKKCKTKMVKGLVTQPLLGHSSARKPVRGDCIYAVSGAVVTCLRCPECGYSVTSENIYTWAGSKGVVKQSDM